MPALALSLGRHRVSTFRACGYVGLAAATATALGAAGRIGISRPTELALIAAAVLTFFAVAALTAAWTGEDRLIYYHHEIAVLTVCGCVAAVAGAPVLAHLDATALGLGAFLACGRIGCTAAGCCHGRPGGWGPAYGRAHVEAGLPRHLCGLRLLPVPLIEAAIVAGLVIAGLLALRGAPAGTAFGLYVGGYALARFALEELRGDAGRRRWREVTEAQWTSVAITIGLAGCAAAGLIPGAGEHVGAAAVLLAAAGWKLAGGPSRALLAGRHVRELEAVLPAAGAAEPHVVETSLGLCVSAGLAGTTPHYALSRRGGPLGPALASALADRAVAPRHPEAALTTVPGSAGVVHVVVGALAPASPRSTAARR